MSATLFGNPRNRLTGIQEHFERAPGVRTYGARKRLR
jgi:hypothetical protein